MKLSKKLGMVMIASLPVFFVSCSKEETEKPTYTETSEQQRIVGGEEIGNTPVQYFEYTRGGLRHDMLSWRSSSGINYAGSYYTKVLNSWNDVMENFNINNNNEHYFDIDYNYYSVIACWVYAPYYGPDIKASLTKGMLSNYQLNVTRSYGMAVLHAVDSRTILIRTPKLPQNAQVKTVLTYETLGGGLGRPQ